MNTNMDYSNPALIIAIVLAVLILIAGVAYFLMQRRKNSSDLRTRFGSEYDRAVTEQGSQHKAEAHLEDREKRVEKLKIRQLGVSQRERFVLDWHTVESRFLDHPKGAVIEADELITSLLQARGYPVANFEQNAEDISVNYPRMMEYYRSAHGIAARPGGSEASTEELRSAMIDYHHLFDELVLEEVPVAV